MERLTEPRTYLIGFTEVDQEALWRYLVETGQEAFLNDFADHANNGEALCSFYAKLCYAALVADSGRNDNISRVREIADNIKATLSHGHSSVFEHVCLNFVTTDCSRVFTHELVRHRVGTAFSQTSGRYVRAKPIRIVFDPILDPVRERIEKLIKWIEDEYAQMEYELGLAADAPEQVKDFALKKKLTSALRRILPNGQTNEIGWSMNVTALRHVIQMRTSRHAEWEIRKVFADVFELVLARFPLLFHDARTEVVDGIIEVTGMKTRPY